jgi:hypothetical protein
MTTDYTDVIGELRYMQKQFAPSCRPKSNQNPRYLALSNAVTGLSKAIADMEDERA